MKTKVAVILSTIMTISVPITVVKSKGFNNTSAGNLTYMFACCDTCLCHNRVVLFMF